jgi:hypothetical protein
LKLARSDGTAFLEIFLPLVQFEPPGISEPLNNAVCTRVGSYVATVATTDPKHHKGRMEVAYTSGTPRTFTIDFHLPSPAREGRNCGNRFTGRLGIVEVVVVVDSSTGTVDVLVLVLVLVDDVVEESLFVGQEAVATVGRTRNGVLPLTGGDVFVLFLIVVPGVLFVVAGVLTVVVGETGATVSSTKMSGSSARESAGATAGGSLCSHVSNLSTTGPRRFSRAHDATFC